MASASYQQIKDSLRQLYLDDPRPWLVGFSGGKDSTMVASLVFDAVLAVPPEQRKKEIAVLCTDTRVEIPAIVEIIEAMLGRMQKFSRDNDLNVEIQLLRPPPEQSFWVNIIGRGYPPPNRTFRWCTQRMKIDPVTTFVNQRIGHWGEAILHLGARRAESATRAQTMAGRETRNGLRRHPDLPRVWVSNPIEFLSTEEVWAYLLQKPNAWGGDNRGLYKLYASASNGECPIQIDTSTPSCGHSRFGCWTCTVVERDKASEGLLAAGDERMEHLLAFRETLMEFRDPANGWRDSRRMNGNDGPGPLLITGRRELLKRLLQLQEETGLTLITPEELLLIQQMWKAARDPDDGRGVARIVNKQRGVIMSADLKELNRLRELEEEIAREKNINPDILRRMLAKVEEYSESHRAHGLPDDLLNILKDDLAEQTAGEKGLIMAEVYIDSLTLENFGPFYGEHTIDFRSLEGKCGVLVGGKNGAGKTHLLRALYLAVVGESGVGDLKKVETGSDATRFAFEKSLNRRALTEGQDTMRLKAVVRLRDDKIGSRKVDLLREVRFRPNSAPVWEHYATRSDTAGRIEDEQVIHKLRDAFLPRHLARFFFFDAERSQSINLGQQDIVEGVSRILGLWTYSELENDLRQLINSKIPRVFNASGGPDPETTLAELNGQVITAEGILKARRKEHDVLERDLHEVEVELLEVEDDLKTLGAVDPDELLKAQERRTELTEAKTKLESKLTEAWELALPVSLLGVYRKELHDALSVEERRREWESAKSTVEPKIPQVKHDVFGRAAEEFVFQC